MRIGYLLKTARHECCAVSDDGVISPAELAETGTQTNRNIHVFTGSSKKYRLFYQRSLNNG